jgi:hypothetical protein
MFWLSLGPPSVSDLAICQVALVGMCPSRRHDRVRAPTPSPRASFPSVSFLARVAS